MSNSTSLRQLSLMSEWHSERWTGCWVARRVAKLTDYQLLNGCLEEVRAQDQGELWLLCDAQSRLSQRVALADAMRLRP